MSALRSALRLPIRPAASLRAIVASGGALPFAVGFALVISLLAGWRAGLLQEGGGFSAARFGSSLFGFVLLPAVAWGGGRLLGGRGRAVAVAAAFVGAGLPFLLVDAAWIAAGGLEAAAQVLVPAERASWAWALVLLVAGLAEVQGFSRWRALASVGIVAAAMGLLVGAFLGLRALGG